MTVVRKIEVRIRPDTTRLARELARAHMVFAARAFARWRSQVRSA